MAHKIIPILGLLILTLHACDSESSNNTGGANNAAGGSPNGGTPNNAGGAGTSNVGGLPSGEGGGGSLNANGGGGNHGGETLSANGGGGASTTDPGTGGGGATNLGGNAGGESGGFGGSGIGGSSSPADASCGDVLSHTANASELDSDSQILFDDLMACACEAGGPCYNKCKTSTVCGGSLTLALCSGCLLNTSTGCGNEYSACQAD